MSFRQKEGFFILIKGYYILNTKISLRVKSVAVSNTLYFICSTAAITTHCFHRFPKAISKSNVHYTRVAGEYEIFFCIFKISKSFHYLRIEDDKLISRARNQYQGFDLFRLFKNQAMLPGEVTYIFYKNESAGFQFFNGLFLGHFMHFLNGNSIVFSFVFNQV